MSYSTSPTSEFSNTVHACLHIGAYGPRPPVLFGEMALLNPSGNAITSVRAKGYAETYHLSSNSYEHLLKQFPTFREYIELVVKLRLAEDLRVNDPTVKVHTVPFLAAFTLPLRCRYSASLPLCPHPLCPP